MEKILFACDIDNTLIHSYKYRRSGDISVEWIDGKELAYMTKTAFQLLNEIWDEVCLIPVTTRSVEQYQRVHWPGGRVPALALAANGGVLLRDGLQDTAWAHQTAAVVEPCRTELEVLRGELEQAGGFSRCKLIDQSYLYIHYLTIEPARCCEEKYYGRTQVSVCRSGRKVYFFPLGIDKGTALRKLCRQLGPGMLVSAGDSEIDIPMLAAADCSFVPSKEIADSLPGKKCMICPEGQVFSEFVLSSVKNLIL